LICGKILIILYQFRRSNEANTPIHIAFSARTAGAASFEKVPGAPVFLVPSFYRRERIFYENVWR
jgi:hypothetical protein